MKPGDWIVFMTKSGNTCIGRVEKISGHTVSVRKWVDRRTKRWTNYCYLIRREWITGTPVMSDPRYQAALLTEYGRKEFP